MTLKRRSVPWMWLGLCVSAVCLLAACGFHLKGLDVQSPSVAQTFPFHSFAFSSASPSDLVRTIKNMLLDKPNLNWEQDEEHADVVLSVRESKDKQVQALNRGGKIYEYLLLYDLEAKLVWKDNVYPEEMIAIRRQRELTQVDQEILGKEQEEQLLFEDMKREALTSLLLRLGRQR